MCSIWLRIKNIFISMTLNLTLLWNRGLEQIENSLLVTSLGGNVFFLGLSGWQCRMHPLCLYSAITKLTGFQFFLYQITAMYIDGHLKGGFQTVKAYADFCGYFKNWLDAKSIKLWVPRQGELVAEDYRACLEYVNGEVCCSLSRKF